MLRIVGVLAGQSMIDDASVSQYRNFQLRSRAGYCVGLD